MRVDGLLLSPRTIALIERASLLLGLLAIGYLGGSVAAGQVLAGVITAGAMFVSLVSFGCTESRDRERGVWMVCALLVVFWGAIAVLCIAGVAGDLRAGRGKAVQFIDFGGAMIVLFVMLWAVASAGIWNWRRFRGGEGGQMVPPPPVDPGLVPDSRKPRGPHRPALSAYAVPESSSM